MLNYSSIYAKALLKIEKKAEKFLPWIATFFIYPIRNWMELIPGFSAFGFKETLDGKEAIIPF